MKKQLMSNKLVKTVSYWTLKTLYKNWLSLSQDIDIFIEIIFVYGEFVKKKCINFATAIWHKLVLPQISEFFWHFVIMVFDMVAKSC